jgi:hypothetical protein
MDMTNKELNERILNHYMKVLSESYADKKEAYSVYYDTYHDVIKELVPYALENNFWWEKNDVKMAYYQMQISTLVVNPKVFKKYYHKLMGSRFDQIAFADPEKRKEILKEADLRYNKKMKCR